MSFAHGCSWTIHSKRDGAIGWSRTAWGVPSWPTCDMHCSVLIEPQGGVSGSQRHELGHCSTHSELCRSQGTRRLPDHCKPGTHLLPWLLHQLGLTWWLAAWLC